ncbi:MAG: 4-(cytidine 5'-diphospho)-2-C-methyl-D-erythritol kinase [Clostridia bacterium]|nr:MAG: 4-(cytidine 5'-diphospho)-2-C-methyl-D-erythritol kinase [Clostridia bacterium]
MRLELPAYGKINFTLEVYGRRADGFHEISTVLQGISLADRVEVELGGDGTRLAVSGSGVPSGPGNLAWRAVEALRERTGFRGGVQVHLVKNIPVASGLGGGSSDAAAVLVGLNALAGVGLTPGGLLEIAAGLGSDVPFAVMAATALAGGRGEELVWLPPPPPMWLVLAMPALQIPAATAYRLWDETGKVTCGASARVARGLRNGRKEGVLANLRNSLEGPVMQAYPQVGELKSRMEGLGLVALMSGSGPCVYGVAPGREEARRAAEALRPWYPWVDMACTLGGQAAVPLPAPAASGRKPCQ